MRRALMLTVGTGDVEQRRATLIEPLKMSVRKGEWTKVVLLPSQLTAESAASLCAELADVPIEVSALPKAGLEDDADACFAHFDDQISALRAQGYTENDILVDFTRGTKAMSAALVLAATRHDLPRLRYITGQRDGRGMVMPGFESVREFNARLALARKRLDEAWRFMQRGNFAAVLATVPDPVGPFAAAWPADLLAMARFVRPLAEFYAAWDRLDYGGADAIEIPAAPRPTEWDTCVPSSVARQWVAALARPFPNTSADRAAHLRRLAIDLLANGERRIRDHHYEDAVLRAYRILEMVGQIRLFERGEERGAMELHRDDVNKRLISLGDPFGRRLRDIAKEGIVQATARNRSVLIHGFEPVGGSDEGRVRDLYTRLQKVIEEDGGPEAQRRLAVARSLNLSEG